MSQLYNDRGNLAIGFHGCTKDVAMKLISNPADIRLSENDYDWLGSGFYIWENNLERAREWAIDTHGENGAVVGVVYELGTCLDLMDSCCIDLVKAARIDFEELMASLELPLPVNRDIKNDLHKDKILRNYDCAVINHLTRTTDAAYAEDVKSQGFSQTQVFDSVRGCFWEGGKIDNMEIYEKTHIQIAIRNVNCIRGIFLPREELFFPQSLMEQQEVKDA